MPTENEIVQTQEELEAEAAFTQGFAGARGEEPPAPEADKPAPTEANPAAAEPAGTEAPPGEVPPEASAKAPDPVKLEDEPSAVPGLTNGQLQAMLAKLPKVDELEHATQESVRGLHSKFGELNRTIQELKSGSGGKPIRLTQESLGRLNKEFPEIAQLLADDLSEALQTGSTGGSSGIDPTQVEPVIAQRVEAETLKVSQAFEGKLLTFVHRDWPNVVASDGFKVWAQTLDAKTQEDLNNSWDALWLADKITEYKQWAKDTRAKSESRTKRLEDALLPQGNTPPASSALSDEDAFTAGFKAVRG